MEIISHRGYWLEPIEKNTEVAFRRSFDLDMGTETDLRDYKGEIVISHDIPDESSMRFETLLEIMNGRNLTLALNIKADGLAEKLKNTLKQYSHTNYFAFDMSIPDLVKYLEHEMSVYTGLSDIQKEPVLLSDCDGIWLDSFRSEWYDSKLVDSLLDKNKKLCIVSSDLHKRDTTHQWDTLKNVRKIKSQNLMLCTDKPLEAKSFFGV